MADLVITAANVARTSPGFSGAAIKSGIAGEPITAGQAIRRGHPTDATDAKIYLADANAAAGAAAAVCDGVALNGAAAGQPINYASAGDVINPGATVAVGRIYIVSATPGGIAPAADQTTGWFPSVVGVAESSSALRLICQAGAGAWA